VVVFNVPGMEESNYLVPRENWRDYPVDLRTNYVKRCVGVAGDTLMIRDMDVFVNGQKQSRPKEMQKLYSLVSKDEINERNLKRFGIGKEDIGQVSRTNNDQIQYLVFLTDERANQIRSEKPPYIVSLAEEEKSGEITFPYHHTRPAKRFVNWDENNFGPLWIPKKGAELVLNDSTLSIYGSTIVRHEHNNNAEINNGKLLIDGKEVTIYTFKQDYYFMMGDSRNNSLDSRFWGFVPADHIVGKALFIWFSVDEDESFLNKIRWSRLFNKIE
jgi:signal peptidase I